MSTVTHPEMVRALVKKGEAILASLTPEKADLWHAATGIAGEGGELLEGIAALVDYEKKRVNLLEESGDLYFYIEQLVQRTGIILPWGDIADEAQHMEITPASMLSCAVQIAVCSSQVLDSVKKAAIYNKELDLVLLGTQLYYLLKYLMALGLMFGFTREVALGGNIAKLSKRYEGLKYSDTAAQVRADKVETSGGALLDGT